MEYLLLGVLLVGVLLFLVGWLVMAGICFQRHPVTGLIALIPGVNLLTLPAMWHRVSGWVITSVLGLLLAGGAWFAGAHTHVYSRAQTIGLNVTAPAASAPDVAQQSQTATHTIDIPPAARAAAVPEPQPNPVDILAGAKKLPSTALYQVVFKPVDVSGLTDKTGQYVRITQKDGRKREGKLMSASGNDIGLEEREGGGFTTRTIKLSEIRDAALMTHEQGQE